MHIKSEETLTVSIDNRSFTITAEMGVVKHFPVLVCKALIGKGATQVVRKRTAKVAKGDHPA